MSATEKKPEKKKRKEPCGLVCYWSGPNGGTRTRCTKDRGHKGDCG